jgi:hypothetical protein
MILKLKKLFIVEIAALVIAVVVLMFSIEGSPFLAASKPDSSVDVYAQKEFATGTATLTKGQRATASFNYSTYDPVILVLELKFQSWETPGNFSIYCNTKRLTSVYASPETPQLSLKAVSLSGLDWVDSPTLISPNAINRIIFVSEAENGYAGTFSYELYVRGSR